MIHLKKLKSLPLLMLHDSSKPPSSSASFLGLGPLRFRFLRGQGDPNPNVCRFHTSKKTRRTPLLSSSDGDDGVNNGNDNDTSNENSKNSSSSSIERSGRRRRSSGRRISGRASSEAQAAVLDYLHLTRGILFPLAEHMSSHSPLFLRSLLQKIDHFQPGIGARGGGCILKSITHFLRYHPINEFELFFESIGLSPSRFAPLLPRHLMFLADQPLLLENYSALRNFGIAPHDIGKIYAEATQVFRYDHGVLQSELQALQGLQQPFPSEVADLSFRVKLVAFAPSVLIPDHRSLFFEVLEALMHLGIDHGWIQGNLSEAHSSDWRQILRLLRFLSKLGCNKDRFRDSIIRRPQLLFEGSGNATFAVLGFLIKFGLPMGEIASVFLQFPQVQVGNFLLNLQLGNRFLRYGDGVPRDRQNRSSACSIDWFLFPQDSQYCPFSFKCQQKANSYRHQAKP